MVLYYLLQPYNVNLERKSATYGVLNWGAYMAGRLTIRGRLPTLYFDVAVSAFCIRRVLSGEKIIYNRRNKEYNKSIKPFTKGLPGNGTKSRKGGKIMTKIENKTPVAQDGVNAAGTPISDEEVGRVAGGVSVSASKVCPYCGEAFGAKSYSQHLAECEERP